MQGRNLRLRCRERNIEKMRGFWSFCLLLALAAAAGGQTFYGTTDVKAFREGRDKEFRDSKESPLRIEDIAAFKGLKYFDIDERFRVEATFTRTSAEKYFDMPTSSGTTKKFVKYGVLRFRIGGKPLTLSVYQIDPAVRAKFPEYADLLFVPFKDESNRRETYGGGRYIDILMPKGETVTVDFNNAYNPNCAYGSDRYNCPIPPRENRLPIAVNAGEKRFQYSGSDKEH